MSGVIMLVKSTVGGQDESVVPGSTDGFTGYAVISLHWFRIYLRKSYWVTLKLVSEMPQILGEIGRVEPISPSLDVSEGV